MTSLFKQNQCLFSLSKLAIEDPFAIPITPTYRLGFWRARTSLESYQATPRPLENDAGGSEIDTLSLLLGDGFEVAQGEKKGHNRQTFHLQPGHWSFWLEPWQKHWPCPVLCAGTFHRLCSTPALCLGLFVTVSAHSRTPTLFAWQPACSPPFSSTILSKGRGITFSLWLPGSRPMTLVLAGPFRPGCHPASGGVQI